MKCFTHRDVDGVACCQGCGRALCHDCCAQVGRRIACKDQCEREVREYAAALERSKVQLGQSPALLNGIRLLCAAFGWLIVSVGVASLIFGWLAGDVEAAVLPGGVSLAFGGLLLIVRRRLPRIDAAEGTSTGA